MKLSGADKDELRNLASASGLEVDPALLEHLIELIAIGVPARDVVNYLRAICAPAIGAPALKAAPVPTGTVFAR